MSSGISKIRTFLGRQEFLFGITITGAIGLTLVTIGHTSLVWSKDSAWKQLLGTLGDAFVIAVILAVLIDPIAQIRFARRRGRDVFWAIFNPNAPDRFRDALKELAAPKGFFQRCTYTFVMEWAQDSKDALNVRLDVSIVATVLNPAGFNPGAKVYALGSHDGSRAHYVSWSFMGDDVPSADFDDYELGMEGVQEWSPSGHTTLDQGMLNYKSVVPVGKTYITKRSISMTRSKCDNLPVWQSDVVLEQLIIVRGSAVPDLNFSVFQLAGPVIDKEEGSNQTRNDEIRFPIPYVAFPGQASVLEWKSRQPR